MDFLDPKKKRNRRIRLNIGHALTVVLVFIATYILVFQAYGYEVNTKTGEVIQNGLVYIDSAPDGARIKINGQDQKSTTNTRQNLPEGQYSLELSKDGYRNWSRNFELNGGEVLRFTYPVLFPQTLSPEQLQTFDNTDFSTQSPNRRWVILQQKNNLTQMTLYDLEKRTDDLPTSANIAFPAGLFTATAGDHKLKLVEWSTDNRHVLVEHNWTGGHEFVMLDREKPTESYNVNKTLNTNPAKVTLFDKNFEKLFLYDATTSNLSIADVKARTAEQYATKVISYKSHGDDTVLMAVASEKDTTKSDVVIRQKDKTYKIREIPLADTIPLDIARYDSNWYVAIAVESEHKSYIYKNPIELSEGRGTIDSVGAAILKNAGPIDQLAFSKNARFIMSSSGQNFSVYDAELEKRFSYNIEQPLDLSVQKPYWMDGHRILSNTGGKVIVFDFDGTNVQTLVNSNPAFQAMFDRDYTELYTLGASSSEPARQGLFITQLRLQGDK